MTLTELRRLVYVKMGKIPSWIDTKSVDDHVVWDAMTEINDLLLILLSEKILTQKTISRICTKFDDILVPACIASGCEKQIRIYKYYITLVEDMTKLFQEEERFEICTNLKLFYDSYFQNDDYNND